MTAANKPTTNLVSRRGFEWFAVIVLASTTMFWGILGARLHAANADQLVDSYLFENANTFSGASFPAQHTFLLKWPLFWLQSVFGLNRVSFIIMTLLVVSLTVGGLAYLLRRIESRPAVRGVLYLALASVLLLTPSVPYPGALLPTNLAMLTTRNAEYILYIGALIILARKTLHPRRQFILGTACLVLLFASDGLFPALCVGGAVLLFAMSAFLRRRELRAFAARWLGAGVLAYVAMTALLRILSWIAPGIINGRSDPYRLIHSMHDAALAVFYGFSALLTNFGANPAYAANTLHDIPHSVMSELGSAGLAAYVVNISLFCLASWAAYRLVRQTLFKKATKQSGKVEPTPVAVLLALALIASTLVAVVSFIATDHYYVVDSRYLTIFLFAGFVSIAVYVRTKTISFKQAQIAAIVCCVAIMSGCFVAVRTYNHAAQTNAPYVERNDKIAHILGERKSTLLVGDYWRVLPVKLASTNRQTVLPLAACTTARNTLTSTTWQPSLATRSFAYLLTLEDGATGYPSCTMEQVIGAYGTPDARVVVAGSQNQPTELLLFYDHGVMTSTP